MGMRSASMFQMGGELFAIVGVLELAIAGQRGGEAALARSHRVALSGDGERRSSGAADVAGEQREVVDRRNRDRALRGVVDAHRPADERGLRVAVEHRLCWSPWFG